MVSFTETVCINLQYNTCCLVISNNQISDRYKSKPFLDDNLDVGQNLKYVFRSVEHITFSQNVFESPLLYDCC